MDIIVPGREFQSLFSWNLLLMAIKITPSSSCASVSILVFVELALDAGEVRILAQVVHGVSILVFVELALDAQDD